VVGSSSAHIAEQLETFADGAAPRPGLTVGEVTGADPRKVGFLFTGQGSQYVNMLRDLRDIEPIVAETYDEADRVMERSARRENAAA